MSVVITGELVEVKDVPEGSSIVGAVAAGATQVPVANVDDFGDEGICVINGQSYTYTVVDPYAGLSDTELEALLDDQDGAGTLTITPPLTAAADDGDDVAACNAWGKPELVRIALVRLYADDQEPTPVDVPTGTRGYLEPGTYQAGSLVDVESVGMSYRLVTLPTEEPELDGSVVTPPADLWGSTPLQTHEDAVAAIEADILAARQEADSGDSALSTRITNEVNTLNAALATKSKHTLSANAPGVTANNAGDVWEQHKAGDTTKIIARWRGMGGTSWSAMNLDATYIPLLDIGSGTFGDLSGERILAKTIGVQQLVVTNFDNLISDPRFARPLNDPGGWSSGAAPAGTLTVQPTADQAGTGPALVVTTAAGSRYPVNAGTNQWDVEPGQAFRAVISVHAAATESPDAVRGSIRFTAPDGTFTDRTMTSVGVPSYAAGQWTLRTGTITCPTDKPYHKAYFFLRFETARNGTVKVERVSVTRAADGKLIIDGSLEARHVTADMVEGLLVTGRVLQTDAASNRGIKISTSGILGYDTSGVERFTVNPSTGLVSMIGGSIQSADILGAVVRTATTGNRMELRQENGLGIIKGWSGLANHTSYPTTVTLGQNVGSVTLALSSGTLDGTGGTGAARLELLSASSNRPAAQVYTATSLLVENDVTLGGPSGTNKVTITSLTGSGGATNVQVNNAGVLSRATSSIRYKDNVSALPYDAEQLLRLDPVQYTVKAEADDPRGPFFYSGFIAEQAAELGLEHWIARDEEGRPESFRYDQWTAALHVIARHHEQRHDDHDRRLAALEQRLLTVNTKGLTR